MQVSINVWKHCLYSRWCWARHAQTIPSLAIPSWTLQKYVFSLKSYLKKRIRKGLHHQTGAERNSALLQLAVQKLSPETKWRMVRLKHRFLHHSEDDLPVLYA